MHQNPVTSPNSPGSSKFPCSRGRRACWARFWRSDRRFKHSCRWRKETLQELRNERTEPCGMLRDPYQFGHSGTLDFFWESSCWPFFSGRCTSNCHPSVIPHSHILHHPCLILLQMSAIPQRCSSISPRPRLLLGSSTCRWWHLVCKAFNCISRFKRGSSNSSKGGASLGAVAAAFQHIHGFKGMANMHYALCLHRLFPYNSPQVSCETKIL